MAKKHKNDVWNFLFLMMNCPKNHCLKTFTEITYYKIRENAIANAHDNAYKLPKIVNMNTDISETIKDRELGF